MMRNRCDGTGRRKEEGRTGEEESDETSLRRGEGDLEEVEVEGISIFCTASDQFDPTLLLTPSIAST